MNGAETRDDTERVIIIVQCILKDTKKICNWIFSPGGNFNLIKFILLFVQPDATYLSNDGVT